jgi:PKD repeat protein
MIYDPVTGQFVLFGGTSGVALGDTWVFSGGNWTDLTPKLTTAPSPRWYYGFVWDAADQYGLLFGGRNATSDLNDTWEFNGTVWHRILTATAPPPLTTSRMVYDAADGYVWLYGGYSIMAGAPSMYNFTWTYRAGNWTNISAQVTGAPPDSHAVTYAVYDSTDGYVLMYGGSSISSTSCSLAANTWTYLNGTYTNLTSRIASAPPVSLGSRMMADDPSIGGVVLYGGWDGGYCPYENETWEYRNGTWYNESPSYNPGPLWDGPTAGDGPAGSVLLFGGNTIPNTGTQSSETWNFTPALEVMISNRSFEGIVPFTVQANSTAAGLGPFSYNWSWGDGSAKNTTENATHTYIAAGIYTITLSVTDLFGKITDATARVGAYGALTALANSSVETGDAPLTVQFSSSIVGGVPPVKVAWAFGDGGTATTASPVHTYLNAGNFTWWLNATDAQGHRSTDLGTVLVTPALLATPVGLNATRGTVPLWVSLSTIASGGRGPYAYLWRFGDGTTSTAGNVTSHLYSSIGTYEGNVTVTDANAGQVVRDFSVEVAEPMSVNALATPTVGLVPLPVEFEATGSGGFPPYSYSWSFGTSAVSVNQSSTGYTYLDPGTYLPVLKINDSDGHQIITDLSIRAVRPLTLSLAQSPRLVITGNPVDFEVNTTGGLGPFTFAWGFGDGTDVTGSANESHTYRASGDFRVTVSVTDELSEVQSSSVTAEIVAPLVVSVAANLTNLTVGEAYSIDAEVAGGLAPTVLNWTGLPPGCPASPSSAQISCVAERTGTYSVYVWVNDSAGQGRHANVTVVISTAPSGTPSSGIALPWVDVGLLAVVAIAILAVAVVVWVRRRPPSDPAASGAVPTDLAEPAYDSPPGPG